MTEPDDDGCRLCGNWVTLSDGMEFPDGRPICWECLWKERTELLKALQEVLATGRYEIKGIVARSKARAAIAKALGE